MQSKHLKTLIKNLRRASLQPIKLVLKKKTVEGSKLAESNFRKKLPVGRKVRYWSGGGVREEDFTIYFKSSQCDGDVQVALCSRCMLSVLQHFSIERTGASISPKAFANFGQRSLDKRDIRFCAMRSFVNRFISKKCDKIKIG